MILVELEARQIYLHFERNFNFIWRSVVILNCFTGGMIVVALHTTVHALWQL